MTWMLVVLVFGTHPVETNLLFDNLDACLKAEENMRKEYARAQPGHLGCRHRRGERSLGCQPVWAENDRNLRSTCVVCCGFVGNPFPAAGLQGKRNALS